MKTLLLALGMTFALAGTSQAVEPIVGKWRSPDGGIVEIAACGGTYCAQVVAGRHKGKDVGQMQGAGSSYAGTVTDPRDQRTYEGTATVEEGELTLTGCALKVFCKTQVWVRL